MSTFEALQPRPTFRSSAVARMADMPVSTLRIWEQRYQAVAPTKAPTGHRQYSVQDVERVVLLRQLTQLGHAIGSLAGMTIEQLREVSRTHAATTQANETSASVRNAVLRIVVVGRAMARRLERPSMLKRWPSAPTVLAVFDSLEDAAQAIDSPNSPPIDLLVWHAPDLQADALPSLKAAQRAWRACHVGVAYRFAGAAARDAMVKGGAGVVREPSDDAALVAWLCSLAPLSRGEVEERSASRSEWSAEPWTLEALTLGTEAAPARRFDDATLTKFAGMSSSISCECPGHVAELLMQLAGFESYSASCSSRSVADAELHAYLHRVAGAARALFEAALERVATTEGLELPRT